MYNQLDSFEESISFDKDKYERIISDLGLKFIKNFVHKVKEFQDKVSFPVVAIQSALRKLNLGFDNCTFKIEVEHTKINRTKKILYTARCFIKNCEIAAGRDPNEKHAKKLAAQAVIETLINLCKIYRYSGEEMQTKQIETHVSF